MTPLPLRELLGTLVEGLIVAEGHAAAATVDFLRGAGFLGNNRSSDNWGQLRFVTFSFKTQEPTDQKTRTIRVPLLSLLPIPLQQIDQAEYEFFAKVNDVKQIDPAKGSPKSGSTVQGVARPYTDLVCEVAPYFFESAPGKKSSDPKVRVKLTMRQSDLPAGLASSLRRIEETSGSKPV